MTEQTRWLFEGDTPIPHELNQHHKVLSQSHLLILKLLAEKGPMTDKDIYRLVRHLISPSGARTRRNELVEEGLVVNSGKDPETGSKIWSVRQ